MLTFVGSFLDKIFADLPLYVCLVFFYVRFEARLSRIEGALSFCSRPSRPADISVSDIDI
jgi:hypothetical protein